MVNFILPAPEVDPNGNTIERKVKEWALKKMAQQFTNWKKRLHADFIKKDKTPPFTGGYEKIKDYWEEFVAYKKSEEAKERSEKNKKNAAKKKYHHKLGQGGYKAGKPKWEKLENDLLAKGINPEPLKWIERVKDWFYGHGGTLDSEGKCIYTKKHAEEPPLPIEAIRTAVKDVEEGRFHPDREKDELTRVLGNDEHTGRTRGTPGSNPWKIGFPVGRKKYPDRSRQRRKEREADRMHKIEEQLKRHQDMFEALSLQGATEGVRSRKQKISYEQIYQDLLCEMKVTSGSNGIHTLEDRNAFHVPNGKRCRCSRTAELTSRSCSRTKR